MADITPLEFASSMLIQNLIIGFILSFFIAAIMKKEGARSEERGARSEE
jgi:hypothetical protein